MNVSSSGPSNALVDSIFNRCIKIFFVVNII